MNKALFQSLKISVCKSGKSCRVLFEQFHFEVHVRSEIFAWSQLDSPPEFVMETVDNAHLTYLYYVLYLTYYTYLNHGRTIFDTPNYI